MVKKVAVVLSGCGYLDGSEIHEAVACLLAIKQAKLSYACFAPDLPQTNSINHLSKEEQSDSRRVLVESARIARSEISALQDLDPSKYSALVLPGGFGAATTLCNFAEAQANTEILPELEEILEAFHKDKKPFLMTCIAPAIAAAFFIKRGLIPMLTLGPDKEANASFTSKGCSGEGCHADEFIYDKALNLYTTPAYMDTKASIDQVFKGIYLSVENLAKHL